jgi:hypothetical protein
LSVITNPANAPHVNISNSVKRLPVDIAKTDINGVNIDDARLVLQEISPDNVQIDEWISKSTEDHRVSLKWGRTYKLTETIQPNGYTKAEDITFRINDQGKVEIKQANDTWVSQDANRVVMKDDYQLYDVYIPKRIFGTTTNLAGATLEVYDDSGALVAGPIQSTTNDTKVELKFGDYTLKEINAPSKYLKAADVKFNVARDGTVTFIEGLDGNVLHSENKWIVAMYDKALHDLTVTKKVKGTFGNLNKEFEFKITLTGLIPGTTYSVVGADAKTFVAGSDGTQEVVVKLKGGESTTVKDLPDTVTWKVEESASDHIARYDITTTGTKVITSTTAENTEYNEALCTGTETLGYNSGDITTLFTNSRDMKNVTGVDSINTNIWLFVGLGSLLLMLGIGAVVLVHKRRKSIM